MPKQKPYIGIYMSAVEKQRFENLVDGYFILGVTRQQFFRAALALGVSLLNDVDRGAIKPNCGDGELVIDGRNLVAALMGVAAAPKVLGKFLGLIGTTVDLSEAIREWEAI